MLDWPDMERLRVLAGRAKSGVISLEEKNEVRTIMAKGAPQVADFSWGDLLDVAFMWLGVYSIAKLGRRAAAADAS